MTLGFTPDDQLWMVSMQHDPHDSEKAMFSAPIAIWVCPKIGDPKNKVVDHLSHSNPPNFGLQSLISEQMIEKLILPPSLRDEGFSETLRKALRTLAQPSSARAGCGAEDDIPRENVHFGGCMNFALSEQVGTCKLFGCP